MIAKAPVALVNLDDVVEGVFSNVTTNLTRSECIGLASQAGSFLTHDIIQGSIPLANTYSNATINGMSVLSVDFEANNAYIRTEIYGE